MIIDSQSVVQYTIKIDILEKLYKFSTKFIPFNC
ncbi:hypothetical protein [Shigella phage ESh24]|nr:hypothetical protein [Shigella phage ESh24]